MRGAIAPLKTARIIRVFLLRHKKMTMRQRRLLAGVIALLVGLSPLFVLSSVRAAGYTMRTGYYVGTGATQSISGLGSKPDLVIIIPSNAQISVFTTSAMSDQGTAFFNATANDTGNQLVLDTDGFTVGTIANVNSINVLYRWIAFFGSDCSATGNFCIGQYTGNGNASRTISTGFSPDMIAVKRTNNIGAHFHTASMAANRTEFFTTTAANTAGAFISNSVATGFTVGSSDNVNNSVYNYFVFKSTAGAFDEGSYTGTGAAHSVSGVGFQPDMVIVKNSTGTTANNRRSIISTDKHFGDDTSYLSDAVAEVSGQIQAMESDGFRVGPGLQANQSGVTEYYMAFGGAPSPSGASGSFKMAQGSYTGNGAARSIGNVGFKPDLVMINGEAATFAVYRTNYMVGDATTYFASNVADFTGGITSLDTNGFSLGTNATVNTAGTIYHWQAFGGAYNSSTMTGSSDFATGIYYGTAADNRDIQDLPFQPDLLVVKRNGASLATVRSSQYTGDLSGYFNTTADAANIIQGFTANGFQVGTNLVSNGSGSLYRWFAFKSGTNFYLSSYTGNGTNGAQVGSPFWSDLIWVNRNGTSNAVQRPSTMSGMSTQSFMNSALITNGITGINASGFTVGTHASVNASSGAYRYAAWRVPPTGSLSVDVVDTGGVSVTSPYVSFSSLSTVFTCTASAATLGGAGQKIRVRNMSANGNWSLSLAPTQGSTALWTGGGGSSFYDYNDTGGAEAGCGDSGDSDTFAGKLRVSPTASVLTPQAGCSTTNVSKGTDQDYTEGSVASVTLLTGSSGSNTECYWDITGIGLEQKVPPEQRPGTYSLDLTLTVTAQ